MKLIRKIILAYRQGAKKRPSKILMHPCNRYRIKFRTQIDGIKVVTHTHCPTDKIYVL